ncbi:MAG: hypothetical protein AAFY36_04610, partial [Bacteroidota bacterium]
MVEVKSQPQPEISVSEASYMPMMQFIEHMATMEDANPYPSTFSFQPFLEKIKEHNSQLTSSTQGVASSVIEMAEATLTGLVDPSNLEDAEDREQVVNLLFPSLFFEGQLGFVVKPFDKGFFYITPALQELFNSEEWAIKMAGSLPEGKMGSPITEAGKHILNTLHGQSITLNTNQIMSFKSLKTGLSKHYKMDLIFDYVNVNPKKKVKALSDDRIFELLNRWEDESYWLKQFSPKDYAFEGFVIGFFQDVTETQVLSRMKELMVNESDVELVDSTTLRNQLSHLIRSFLDMPDVVFGNLLNREFKYGHLYSWSILGDLDTISKFNQGDFCNCGSYGKAFNDRQQIIIGDLQALENPSVVETKLIEQGYRSLLLSPQKDHNDEIVGIMELTSKQPYRFNQQMLDRLSEVISLFSLGTNRWINGMDTNVNFFIQKQFTYIHPSVEWKFQEVSQKYLFHALENGEAPSLDPIVFKNVYPMYGQADIVGSSKIRNRSIEQDMLDNLERVNVVLKAFRELLDFQLLDIYISKTESCIARIQEGGFISSDESQIVDLLVSEIHPLLQELADKYAFLPAEALKEYQDYLDPKLGIVYRQRKDYEDSVQGINAIIGSYIDEEVAKKQEILPHFFEKYITDGVEYNMYLGETLLPDGQFSDFFLKDFRLWQLMLMCEVTRLVKDHKDDLPVPLTTAQLIFVYNNSLSIRFNMDEKQFDVDGAYNVRYEILKKRIDK